ncbi:hypothetical protein ACMXYX_11030 [Neptuniibacter sp. QD72_48]|uniref:hypothetical protein n=1 Tax=unclassified Neptuniibacter TaxID=2630693 RepID=UPI0039F654B2
MEVPALTLHFLAVISATIVLPLKIAASWFDASRTNFFLCLIAALLGPALALFVYDAVDGGFIGFFAALVTLGITLGVLLGTGPWNALKLACVALILSAAAIKFYESIASNILI